MTKKELIRFNQLVDIGRRNIQVKYYDYIKQYNPNDIVHDKNIEMHYKNYQNELQQYEDCVKIIKRNLF